MTAKLVPVHISEKPILERLLELYLYDFTEFQDFDIHEDGYFKYEHIDRYWKEEGRYPFFIKVDGKLAGFAFVTYQQEGNEPAYYYMAEFFVMKKYRRSGIGMEAAFEVFNLFPGQWLVTQVPKNKPAQAFWKKIIERYTVGSFEAGVKPSGLTYQKFISTLESEN